MTETPTPLTTARPVALVEMESAGPDGSATRLFSQSVMISGARCLLAYIIFPWVLPFLGVTRDAAPAIGIVISVVAIGFNVASIRRFWKADHRWKWWISAINVTVIAMLLVLLARDISAL